MKKIITAVLVMILSCTAAYAKRTREEIAANVIRLHILANSDSDEDQALKIKIRDRILEEYRPQLSGSADIEKTRQIIYDNLSDIKHLAEKTAAENGYAYTVNVYLAKDVFPTKKYSDVTLPAGEYEALRVEIGRASGKNWWCVMFPPLCYADANDSETAARSKQRLEQLLSGDSYCLITKNSPDVKIKLKIIEIWNGVKDRI